MPHKRSLLHYESKHQPLLGRAEFRKRLLRNFLYASAFIWISLTVGMGGYHYLEGMSWVDAYVNAAMILSGMGPVTELHTVAGKIFAGTYALYSGLTVVLATGFIIAPIVHRIMHRFHAADEQEEQNENDDEDGKKRPDKPKRKS
jgi:hypothetical protein